MQKFLFILLFILWGCQTVEEEQTLPKEEMIQNEIELLIDAMALNNPQTDAICKRLIEYGQVAVPELARNIDNRIPIIRLLCIFCLGQIYEKEKLPSILEIKPRIVNCLLYDNVLEVRFEAAGTLCSLGDYQGIPILLATLKHERSFIRMTAFQALKNAFKKNDLYFNHNAPPSMREEQIQQIEAWWKENRTNFEKK
jgi:HEAT repeat protein